MLKWMALLMPVIVIGCATTPAPSPDPCAGWKFIVIEGDDVSAISPKLAAELRAHDQHWLEACRP